MLLLKDYLQMSQETTGVRHVWHWMSNLWNQKKDTPPHPSYGSFNNVSNEPEKTNKPILIANNNTISPSTMSYFEKQVK